MNKSGGVECIAWTWGIALLVGVFVAAALWSLGGWSFMQGAFMGVLAFLLLGAILTISVCRGDTGPVQMRSKAGGSAEPAAAPVAAAAPVTAAPAPEPVPAPAPAAAPEPAPARADDGVDTGDQADTAGAAPVAPTAAPAAVATGEGTRPEALDGPRGGTADDLKRIKGIGPKLEKLCNSLGFYHFDQIAAWSDEEVAWVDQNLEGFKGRVSRDKWVEQARLLAAGGETDFSKKVDDGDVY